MKSIFVASSESVRRRFELAAALDDFLEQLIDRVLVAVGEAGDRAAHLPADAADEPRRRQVLRVLRRVREQIAQVALVEVRVIEPVVLALLAIVLAERFLQPRQRIDLPLRLDARPRRRQLAHQPVHVFEFPLRRPAGIAASPTSSAGRSRRRRFRRSPRPDGSARTSDRGAARSSCCTASACSTRDTPFADRRTAGGASGVAAAGRRCRSHVPLRGAGCEGTIRDRRLRLRASAARSSFASRGCAR